MKPFWENLFYDLDASKVDREELATSYGDAICLDLDQIGDAIRDNAPYVALGLIEELKKDY
jgi:hypothetical protein